MSKDLRVAIGIPSTGLWVDKFGISLVNMITAFQTTRIGNWSSQMLQVIHVRGSILTKQRRDIVRQARDAKATHLLWIDTDHSFPRDTLHRLLRHDKDVVAVNCVTKCIPAQTTARNKGPKVGQWIPVYSDPDVHGLEKVDRVGTGIMLVNMRVFDKIGYNVFDTFTRKDIDEVQGEDWSMCDAFEEGGFDIYIDHDLSREVGHVGLFEFVHDYVGEVRHVSNDSQG